MSLKSIFALIVFLLSINSYACDQDHEWIFYEGNKYYLYDVPIHYYFLQFPEKQPQHGKIVSTGLYRGYISTYEILNDKIYLKEIIVPIYNERAKTEWKSVKKEIFGDSEYFFLEGYTAYLTIPLEENIQYTNRGKNYISGKYILLEIINGNVKKKTELDMDAYIKFRKSRGLDY